MGRKMKVEKMPPAMMTSYINGDKTRKELAADLKVSNGTIENILQRSGYKPGKRGQGRRKRKVHVPDLAITGLFAGDKTFEETARSLSLTYKGLMNALHAALGYPEREEYQKKLSMMKTARQDKTYGERRNALLAYARDNAVTLQGIGDKFGISRERVRQLLKKYGVDRMRTINCLQCGRLVQCRVGPAVCSDCLLQ